MRALGSIHKNIMDTQESTIPLSEAILLGSTKHPQKFGGFITEKDGKVTETCALVAALDCIGIVDESVEKGQCIQAWKVFPILTKHVNGCPACGKRSTISLGFELIDLTEVAMIIPHLNDDHRWTRPQIAEWVKTVEQSLEVPMAEQPKTMVA